MGDVINLRRERKRKTRETEATVADARRIQFGRSKSEKEGAALARDLTDRRLEGHKLTPRDGDDV